VATHPPDFWTVPEKVIACFSQTEDALHSLLLLFTLASSSCLYLALFDHPGLNARLGCQLPVEKSLSQRHWGLFQQQQTN
jgi:hypothetical protein